MGQKDEDAEEAPFKFFNGDHNSEEGVTKWLRAELAKAERKSRTTPPPLLVILYQKLPRPSIVRRLKNAGGRVLEKPPGFDRADSATRRQMIEKLLEVPSDQQSDEGS